MRLDMHLHEKTFSPDSTLALEEIVALARSRGLDGVCITDHESMGLRGYAAEYSRRTGFPVLVGAEYLTMEGDLTVFGLSSLPTRRLPAQDFLDLVAAEGGIAFSAHPFRDNGRGLGAHLFTLRGLTGIEVQNGSTAPEGNAEALAACTALGIQSVAGSDAHVARQVAVCATELPRYVATVPELIAAFGRCRSRALVYGNGGYEPVAGGG